MKPRISVRLLGRFSVHCDGQELPHSSSKAKEILAYLVVNRRGPVLRESLAGLICHEASTEKSKKAMRQALWQLRGSLSPPSAPGADRILRVESSWVQLVIDDGVFLDVAEFERAAAGRVLNSAASVSGDPATLAQAVKLYRGEFLEGWFQEWCREERERLRQIYLETLDDLVSHCEARRDVKAGVAFATLALHTDSARECTHRSLMRLYSLAGDRASALHQFGRCCSALEQELGIEPDDETRELEQEIRAGHPMSRVPARRTRDVPGDSRKTRLR